MVNVKKRKGRVVIDSDSEDSASDDNLDQVGADIFYCSIEIDHHLRCKRLKMKLANANPTTLASLEPA